MAGGTGTRLWPLSRRKYPKQALNLDGERTLIQHAVQRLTPEFPPEQIFIITRQEHVAPLSAQVPDLPGENFIVEPEGRGTGPAIGLAAVHLQQRDPDAVMAVLTADHLITKSGSFRKALLAAEKVAQDGYLVTLGIKPSFPSTGYGYVQQGDPLILSGMFQVFQAERFVEKPDPESARQMVSSSNYSWNSGMFIWQVKRIMDEFQRQMPNFYEQLLLVKSAINTLDYEQTLSQIWPTVQKETIDYGVMEGAQDVAVIPVDIGWSDVGSWASLFDVLPADEDGNRVIGQHAGIDTRDTLVIGDQRLIATIGLEGLIIIDTEDALLICTREREQDVRAMVKLLEKEGKQELL
jgi:mannose-1-phosphate guanylyltransferase